MVKHTGSVKNNRTIAAKEDLCVICRNWTMPLLTFYGYQY